MLVVGKNPALNPVQFKKVHLFTLDLHLPRFPLADVALRSQRQVDVAGAQQAEERLQSVVRLRRYFTLRCVVRGLVVCLHY